jgi:hypothetical protein
MNTKKIIPFPVPMAETATRRMHSKSPDSVPKTRRTGEEDYVSMQSISTMNNTVYYE